LSNYWPKQRASRPTVYQNIAITTGLTNTSNLLSKFNAENYQIRIWSTLASWLSIGDSSGVSAAAGSGVPIAPAADRRIYGPTTNQARVDGAMKVMTNAADPGTITNRKNDGMFAGYDGVDE